MGPGTRTHNLLLVRQSSYPLHHYSGSTKLRSFVVRTYYGSYLKAESENQLDTRAVLKIFLALNQDVKIIA